MLQLISPLIAQRQQPIVQTNQPLVPSQQLQNLQQQINEVANRPLPNIIVNPPMGQPVQALRRSDSERSDLISDMGRNSSVSSLPSFAFDFGAYDGADRSLLENIGNLSSSSSEASLSSASGQSYVLDQPDSPLVLPKQPLISGSPQRLDPPHEDVPMRSLGLDADGIGEGKQEDEEYRPNLSHNIMPPLEHITKAYLLESNKKKPSALKSVTLYQIANQYGISISREANKLNKAQFVDYIWEQIQKRKNRPAMASSSSSSS
jgi:hypothetical protein